jgi:molecular chaperone DnaK (HSP70)
MSKVHDGIWIGIDFGTSNSTCAVWDSTRGGPKWVRLVKIAPLEDSGKVGRTVPSVVQLIPPLVGAQAMMEVGTGTLLPSIKRFLGKSYNDLDPQLVSLMPFEVEEDDDDDDEHHYLQVVVETKNGQKVRTTPLEITAMILQTIRESAQRYLDVFQTKKHLQIPGNGMIWNVVVGVPAHFSKRHIQLVEQETYDHRKCPENVLRYLHSMNSLSLFFTILFIAD